MLRPKGSFINIAARIPVWHRRQMSKDRLDRILCCVSSGFQCMQTCKVLLSAIQGEVRKLRQGTRYMTISTLFILTYTHDHRHHHYILAWIWALSHATMISRVQTIVAADRDTMASMARMTAHLCQRNSQIAQWRTTSWSTSKIDILIKPSSKDASRGRSRSSTLPRSEM